MGQKKAIGGVDVIRFERDFAVDPLSIGAASLGDLPDGFVVLSVVAKITGTATATSTLTVGEDGGGDADGYGADILASYTTLIPKILKGALIWDATAGDEHPEPFVVDAAKDGVLVTVGTLALAAGKVEIFFHGFQA
jgi:hypothetical protein